MKIKGKLVRSLTPVAGELAIDIIDGRSSPSAYCTSKASRRYSKNSSPCEKPCGNAKRMSLQSSVYGTISCGASEPSLFCTCSQNGRSSP